MTATVSFGIGFASAAYAGGMGEPDAEPEVVVVDSPVSTEPVAAAPDLSEAGPVSETEACGSGCDGSSAAIPTSDSGSDNQPHVTKISRAPDGRVLCLTVPGAVRGGAAPFALCMP